MQLNIIHLPRRSDRYKILMHELASQKITDFKIWEGVEDPTFTFRGISQAHKKIVRFAKKNCLEKVLIAEDDLHFTSPNSFDYFIKNIPANFDLYLASVYDGRIFKDYSIREFAGLTFYIVHKSFYDVFLNVPEISNLDRALKNLGVYFVCNPFCVIQHNGYSDHEKTYCFYQDFMDDKNLYGSI